MLTAVLGAPITHLSSLTSQSLVFGCVSVYAYAAVCADDINVGPECSLNCLSKDRAKYVPLCPHAHPFPPLAQRVLLRAGDEWP